MVFGLKRLAVCELLVELLYFISIVHGDKGLELLQRFSDAMIEQHAIPKCLVGPSSNVGSLVMLY